MCILYVYTTRTKPRAPPLLSLCVYYNLFRLRCRKDDKGGVTPPAGSGSGSGPGQGGGKRGGDQGDGVPTAPSAAVAGAGAGPAGELEFNMAAIDLSDMKVRENYVSSENVKD